MSEYAPRFADNDIDFSILGDLTDRDLKDLGVASLGSSPQDFARNRLRPHLTRVAVSASTDAFMAFLLCFDRLFHSSSQK
jgi:hypothetical protein